MVKWVTIEGDDVKTGNPSANDFVFIEGDLITDTGDIDWATIEGNKIKAVNIQFDVTITGTNEPIKETQTLTVDVDITNNGDVKGTREITLSLSDGVGEVDSQDVTLSQGQTKSITLEWQTSDGDGMTSDYTATAESVGDSDTESVTVNEFSGIGALVDDFEDGDKNVKASNWGGWNGDTDDLSVGSPALVGSFSGTLTSDGVGQKFVATPADNTGQPTSVEYYAQINEQASSAEDGCNIFMFDSSDNLAIAFKFSLDGEFDRGILSNIESLGGSWSTDTTYFVKIKNIDYSNNTWDVTVKDGGTTVLDKTGLDMNYPSGDIKTIHFRSDNDNGTVNTLEFTFDELKVIE